MLGAAGVDVDLIVDPEDIFIDVVVGVDTLVGVTVLGCTGSVCRASAVEPEASAIEPEDDVPLKDF